MKPDGRLAKPNPARDSADDLAAKQAALDRSVAEKWEKFENESGYRYRQTAYVSELVALDGALLQVFDSRTLDAPNPGAVSAAFVTWLLNKHRFPALPAGQDHVHTAAFYGFDIKNLMGIVYMDCVRFGQQPPLGLWFRNDNAFDPLTAVIDSDLSQLANIPKVIEELGIRCPADFVPHKSAVADAVLAMELCARLGLFTDKLVIPLETAVSRPAPRLEATEETAVESLAEVS